MKTPFILSMKVRFALKKLICVVLPLALLCMSCAHVSSQNFAENPPSARADGENAAQSVSSLSATRITGVVTAINPHSLVMSARAITFPDGKTITLKPARPKRILLAPGTTLPAHLKVGSPLTAIGSDTGVGKPLKAIGLGTSPQVAEAAAAKNNALAETTQRMASSLFDIHETLGKGFEAYEPSLGPAYSKEIDNQSQNHGEIRTYSNSALAAKGITKITLASYELIPDNLHAVTTITLVFKPGMSVTWQQGLGLIGISSQNVNPVAQKGEIRQAMNQKGKSYTALLMDGISIPGVPMAKIKTQFFVHPGIGYAVRWYDKNPSEGDVPVLEIQYMNFEI